MNFENIFFGGQSLLLESLFFGLIFFGLILVATTALFRLRKWVAILCSFLILGLAGYVFYGFYLLGSPKVIKVSPGDGETGTALNRRIEVFFDRPVSRPMMEPTLVPEVAGKWVYDEGVIPNHMMRHLSFVANETLPHDTEFMVDIGNIQNVRRTTKAYDYTFKFKTQESPKVSRIVPGNNQKDVSPDANIEVYLSAPNGSLSQINFEFVPAIDFSVKEDITKTHITLSPKTPLVQGTSYDLLVSKADLVRNQASNQVIRTGIENLIFTDSFSVKEAAGIDSFTPEGNKVSSKEPITIRFSKEMVESEIKKNFSVNPPVAGTDLLIDGVIYVFTPTKYDLKTTYTVKLAAGTHAIDGSYLTEDLVHSFTTLGNVMVDKITPRDGTIGADVNSPITIFFDQDVTPETAMTRTTISPATPGKFVLNGKSLIFTPSMPLAYDTKYTVTVAKGVKGTEGLDSVERFSGSFVTEPQTTVLDVPIFLQQHSLSCEAASLRMALAFKKIEVSEDQLINQIGFDPTSHQGNIWGNPYNAFVGNIDGKQMSTGYGVYWTPIYKVASSYTGAREFSGWGAVDVFTEVKKGNPVIIWTNSNGGQSSYWNTPNGERIFAVAGEHSVVIVGFVGSEENPSQIIVNDPLEGRVYWTKDVFDHKFATFVGSGVVIQ